MLREIQDNYHGTESNYKRSLKYSMHIVISDQSTAIKKFVRDLFPHCHHHFWACNFSQKTKNQKLRDSFQILLKAENPIQFYFELNKLLNEFPNDSEVHKIVQFTNFCRFSESIYLNTRLYLLLNRSIVKSKILTTACQQKCLNILNLFLTDLQFSLQTQMNLYYEL